MPDPLALHGSFHQPDLVGGLTHVISERRLARLLAFAGKSIDDVVNCGVSKRLVAGYFKLDRQVARRVEVLELEDQWNPLGRAASGCNSAWSRFEQLGASFVCKGPVPFHRLPFLPPCSPGPLDA